LVIDLVILLLVTIAILLFRAERVLSRIARTITDCGTALPMAFAQTKSLNNATRPLLRLINAG